MTTVLITGGCGFIGSNFVHLLLAERPDWQVINVDSLTYAGNLANLADVAKNPNYRFARLDIADRPGLDALLADLPEAPGYIVNFAAESHVDRSILGPEVFVRTNIMGTFNLLEIARDLDGCRFVQVSTDEVYGSLGDEGAFTEDTPLQPSNPYSASKAAADLLARSYHHTFAMDVVTTRCSNNYGRFQFPEKLIPLMIINAHSGKPLPVYGSGRNVRDWIHVEDHCRGILAALEQGRGGEVYNFGGLAERRNLDIVQFIADTVCGHRDAIRFVEDRPGHDWRYAMAIDKAKAALGWHPRWTFEAGLADTVRWYLDNQPWWEAVQSQAYREFYDRWYGERTA